jgi:hypothetical protein
MLIEFDILGYMRNPSFAKERCGFTLAPSTAPKSQKRKNEKGKEGVTKWRKVE